MEQGRRKGYLSSFPVSLSYCHSSSLPTLSLRCERKVAFSALRLEAAPAASVSEVKEEALAYTPVALNVSLNGSSSAQGKAQA